MYARWMDLNQSAAESSHAFAKSSLVFGSITGLPAVAIRGMVLPSDPLRPSNHLSSAKRDACFLPGVYEKMYRMAATGTTGPRSKDEVPLLVAVILDPLNGSARQAALPC